MFLIGFDVGGRLGRVECDANFGDGLCIREEHSADQDFHCTDIGLFHRPGIGRGAAAVGEHTRQRKLGWCSGKPESVKLEVEIWSGTHILNFYLSADITQFRDRWMAEGKHRSIVP